MGWFSSDHPGHEGYLVAFVAKRSDSGLVRELGYPEDDEPIPTGRIDFVAVGCECGWRSPRLAAPPRTEWFPHCVELSDERAENGARLIWWEHVHSEGATRKELPRVSYEEAIKLGASTSARTHSGDPLPPRDTWGR